jgi:hypothetical protein
VTAIQITPVQVTIDSKLTVTCFPTSTSL